MNDANHEGPADNDHHRFRVACRRAGVAYVVVHQAHKGGELVKSIERDDGQAVERIIARFDDHKDAEEFADYLEAMSRATLRLVDLGKRAAVAVEKAKADAVEDAGPRIVLPS